MKLFAVLAFSYTLLWLLLAGRAEMSTDQGWAVLIHLMFAAVLNARLVSLLGRGKVCPVESPAAVFLVLSHLFFSVSALRYLGPVYGAVPDLTVEQRLTGSAAGAGVLWLSGYALYLRSPFTRDQVQHWVDVNWRELRFLLFALVALSAVSKAALVSLGYGSAYSGSLYWGGELRSYSDHAWLFASWAAGLLAVPLGVLAIGKQWRDRWVGLGTVAALLGIALSLGFGLLYLKSRRVTFVVFALCICSMWLYAPRRAARALVLVLAIVPALSLAGVEFSRSIGRDLGRDDWGLSSAAAQINGRTDLTDYATALLVPAERLAEPKLVLQGVALAVPQLFWPTKLASVEDRYAAHLSRLGWRDADYPDSIFSSGAMAFGWPGFMAVPLLYVLTLAALPWLVVRCAPPRQAVAAALGFLLLGTNVELHWSTIGPIVRDATLAAMGAAFGMALLYHLRLGPKRSRRYLKGGATFSGR